MANRNKDTVKGGFIKNPGKKSYWDDESSDNRKKKTNKRVEFHRNKDEEKDEDRE